MARILAADKVAGTRTNSVLYNGNFEVKPSVLTAQTNTNTRWIDGTAAGSTAKLAYGWGVKPANITSSAAAGFDTTTFNGGSASMKLSTLDATGAVSVTSAKDTIASNAAYQYFLLPANTPVVLTGWIKTNNVATNSAFIDLGQINASFGSITVTSSTKFTGTNNWTQVTISVTTGATCVFGQVLLRNNVAGNIGDAWFDDITLIPSTTGRTAVSGRITP